MGTLFLSVLQLVVAVLLAAITAYLGVFLFEKATADIDEWEELRKGNVAVGVVLGAIVLSVALILRPAMSTSAINWDVGTQSYPYYALLIEVVQLAVGLVLAVACIAFALWLFARLTRDVDELEELKKGNMAVAALLAGVTVAVALLVSTAIDGIIAGVIPNLF